MDSYTFNIKERSYEGTTWSQAKIKARSKVKAIELFCDKWAPELVGKKDIIGIEFQCGIWTSNVQSIIKD
jgi:hypothetical protein